MRRLIFALAVLMIAPACTPSQRAAWLQWHEADPASAEAWAIDNAATVSKGAVRVNPPEPRPTSDYGACGQWHDLAIAAGFSEGQWANVSRIMYRESRCQPGAHNPAGAHGLMQIMAMWADDCGGVRTDLFDPAFNLSCAVHVLHVQGWGAWSTN